MGGRRPSSLSQVVGKAKKIQKDKRQLTLAISSKKPAKIASSSAKLVANSDFSIDNLAKATKLLGFVAKEVKKEKVLDYDSRKNLASKEWAKIKKSQKIDTSAAIDNIFVTSAAKAIRRRKK